MIKNLILTVFLFFSITLAAAAQNERTSTSQWKHSDGSTELSVTMRDNVRFNDDYTDVLSINGDGSLEVLERRNGVTRLLKIMAGRNGQLVRTYSVNGQEREFDTEGKNWLAKMLAEAVSKGFEARARALQIVRQRGATGILNEIPQLTGDYTKRVYLEEAVKSRSFDSGALQKVLKIIERDISSDYEKATFLINGLSASPANRNTIDAYFQATGTIKSAYEHARVLKAVLKENPENKEILMLTLASAAKISSDYEKANVLIQAVQFNPQDERQRIAASRNMLDAYFAAAGTIKSDYEHARVLKTVLKSHPANKEILMLTLTSASKISSDYEKANVLIQAAQANFQDEGIRNALLTAAKTITSDHERGRVLNVVYLKEVR